MTAAFAIGEPHPPVAIRHLRVLASICDENLDTVDCSLRFSGTALSP
jgi:hypothetical protein